MPTSSTRPFTFRADRYLVGELMDEELSEILVNGVPFDLHDVSMNGVSFTTPTPDSKWTIGEELAISIRVQRQPIYDGKGRVARHEQTASHGRVGMQLLTGFLDLPEMRWRAAEEELNFALQGGAEEIHDAVPVGYRAVIERAAHFISYYRAVLDDAEERYHESGAGADALDSLTERALEALRRPWNEIREAASREAVPFAFDASARKAAKIYTEQMLTALLLDSPYVEHAYSKPMGYAGDYQTMAYIYEDAPEGPSVFASVFHKLAVEEPHAAGVRTERELMRQLTLDEYKRVSGGGRENMRVASVACGLAYEVSEFIDGQWINGPSVHWTLIDREEDGLSVAYHQVFTTIAKADAAASLRCLHASADDLLLEPARLEGEQDFCYAAGVLDSLNDDDAAAFLKVLWQSVAPGGLLAVGNASKPNTHSWFGDFVLDWPLNFRTRDDMKSLGESLDGVVEVKVVDEPSKAHHFLLLRKG